jgi:hypothetical protein
VHVYIVAAPIVLSSLSLLAGSLSDPPGSSIAVGTLRTWLLVGALEDVCHHDIYTATLFATGPYNLTLQRPSATTMHTSEDGADMGRVRKTCCRKCKETGHYACFCVSSPSGPSITSFERDRIRHC